MNDNYIINYTSGATGYGWEHIAKSIKEVEGIVNEYKNVYSAHIRVWSNKHQDFIFWKDVLTYKFDTDLIFTNRQRDLRTKDCLRIN